MLGQTDSIESPLLGSVYQVIYAHEAIVGFGVAMSV
jgi:hypothetical protein